MSLYEIYFSPTGGTKKVADIMIKAMKKDAQEIDMIKDPDKILQTEFSEDDICLIAVPSYGGRIPSVTVDKFQKLQAKGTKAILVAVFGNRAIDDTLVEMQDILENAGFVCVVGVEAVAEHSLMHQFGTGRPDQQDEKERGCHLEQGTCDVEIGHQYGLSGGQDVQNRLIDCAQHASDIVWVQGGLAHVHPLERDDNAADKLLLGQSVVDHACAHEQGKKEQNGDDGACRLV